MSDIHHFKGTINAGIIRWNATVVSGSPTNAGVFILRMNTIPNYIELAGLFEFIRVNRCRLEFLPRYNQSNIPLGTTTASVALRLPTFITGLDEVPLVSTGPANDVAVSNSWVSQGGEASGVVEMAAYQAAGVIGPDYVRGLKTSKETEIYKKHSVSFIPTFYDYVLTNNPQLDAGLVNNQTGCFERKQKKWLNTTILQQNTSTASSEVVSVGPDMYGPVYSFSTAAVTGAANITFEFFDVKLHYSVSTRRYKGPPGPTV